MIGVGGTLLYVGGIFALFAVLAAAADALEAADARRRRRQARADARAKLREGRDRFESEEFSWPLPPSRSR